MSALEQSLIAALICVTLIGGACIVGIIKTLRNHRDMITELLISDTDDAEQVDAILDVIDAVVPLLNRLVRDTLRLQGLDVSALELDQDQLTDEQIKDLLTKAAENPGKMVTATSDDPTPVVHDLVEPEPEEDREPEGPFDDVADLDEVEARKTGAL